MISLAPYEGNKIVPDYFSAESNNFLKFCHYPEVGSRGAGWQTLSTFGQSKVGCLEYLCLANLIDSWL